MKIHDIACLHLDRSIAVYCLCYMGGLRLIDIIQYINTLLLTHLTLTEKDNVQRIIRILYQAPVQLHVFVSVLRRTVTIPLSLFIYPS